MGRLAGKTAIVTGAARGMGAATARLFVKEGATVILADVMEAPGRALAAELGPAAQYHHLDVSSEAAWAALITHVEAEFGTLNVLVNNAGILHFAALLDTTLADFNRVVSVNLAGTFLGIKHAAPLMLRNAGGSIINISSIDGIKGANAVGAYVATKFGVLGLTRVAALELGHKGLRVNAVLPGGIDTPMGNPQGAPAEALNQFYAAVPQQRVGQPEEVAKASLFLASDDASYINGAQLSVDGGWSAGHYYLGYPGAPGM